MSINIRLPNITDNTERGQLLQVKSYLYQLVEQLNLALTDVERVASSAVTTAKASSVASAEKDSQATFNSIKALIIKSADIVNAYYDAISTRLEGEYVATSDFGSYAEKTSQDIKANSTGIEQLYSNLQAIFTDIENVESTLIKVNANINTGIVDYDEKGVPIYGLEIGQRTEIDGAEAFNAYARFTADRLSFFDQNGEEVAYISDQKLYISDVEVKGSFREGGFVDYIMTDLGVVTRWVGKGG